MGPQVEATPYSWPVDGGFNPETTALVIIDMQKDFCSPQGYLVHQGRGFTIYHTREGHRPDLSTLSSRERARSKNNETGMGIGDKGPLGRLLIRGEEGHDIIEELSPKEDEQIIDKPGRSAFQHTEFRLMLNIRGIKNLVICGVTTDVCVHSTMREANDNSFDCILVEDATAASEAHLHSGAIGSVIAEVALRYHPHRPPHDLYREHDSRTTRRADLDYLRRLTPLPQHSTPKPPSQRAHDTWGQGPPSRRPFLASRNFSACPTAHREQSVNTEMSMDEVPSSPPTDLSSPESALVYYKNQYEQLEHELAEFQQSSQELEAELEKDVEAAERRERTLQEKVEGLGFEVDEWKTKYKQSKTEANSAQNTLQKEITTLRDSNRTLQLRLRDIEVANDDFERQARNTSSSLEDLESKYNVAIERAVMMEEEIKVGEQERENLRIETQRLRDELSDLKIEAEILQDKLRKRQLPSLATDITAPNSPSFDGEGSPDSTASSPMISTPPDTKSVSTVDTVSETPTPPSPPMSESSTSTRPVAKTPMNPPKSKLKLPSGDSSTTPKPTSRIPSGNLNLRSSRGPTAPTASSRTRNATPSVIRNARSKAPATRGLPNSTSLTHIRSLTAQMQRLEQRVQSARSKLPAPVTTPPRASPRGVAAMGHNYMAPNVTIRSRKRTIGSTASNSSIGLEDTPSGKHVPKLSTSGIGRLSFGPLPTKEGTDSRPSSRASASSYVRPDRPLSRSELSRPVSRTSMTGARTPLGHYSQSQISEQRRPRSSIGGSYGHGHSQSVSHIDLDESRELDFSTPSRRNTYGKGDLDGSAIPAPSSALPRRKSGGIAIGRRTSSGAGLRDGDAKTSENAMKPPGRPRKLSEVGETY
ncbi:hypothetical protein G7Y89_g2786 [Cudoniella acicularis]|uniref:Isochorismatase-like domain-containing protein n=1 Tax=Cudoniella acicularis TaxID=354080 RepID=A0A8H4RUS1_9HELO|nr:hypothetical protein G7Y89_g2786 [Cudoniella acicularis]